MRYRMSLTAAAFAVFAVVGGAGAALAGSGAPAPAAPASLYELKAEMVNRSDHALKYDADTSNLNASAKWVDGPRDIPAHSSGTFVVKSATYGVNMHLVFKDPRNENIVANGNVNWSSPTNDTKGTDSQSKIINVHGRIGSGRHVDAIYTFVNR
ncbi:hypothetical protein ACFVXW_41320 [Streptomyces sp. NPDC058251]|uniref:hypothetical protein n=1 Tax=unclassified Streptomyces TaxID=2593676 RepID=UPI00365E7FF3